MHTDSTDAPNIHRRRLFSFFVACLFIASLTPSFQSNGQVDLLVSQKVDLTSARKTPEAPAYDCAGEIDHSHIEGHPLIKEAIDEAVKLLGRCESCWRMFDDDKDYAIKLLERMRRDKVIIISAEAPEDDFKLSSDGKRLTVKKRKSLGGAAAATQDVADSKTSVRSRHMAKPCIYINPDEFIAIEKDAGRFGVYGELPEVQRAIAILHELAHVTRVIALDDKDTDEAQEQSMDSTDCIRCNCAECVVVECPGAPPRHTRPGKRVKSGVARSAERARPLCPE